jgi:hypothetical protein
VVTAHLRPIRHRLLTAVLLSLLTACSNDKPTSPTVESQGERIKPPIIVADPTLGPGDSTAVMCLVVASDGETPVPGADVTFSENLSRHSGSFAPNPVRTDAEGWATTFFRSDAGAQGLVTVKATTGTRSAYASIQLVTDEPAGLGITLSTADDVTSIVGDGAASLSIHLVAHRGTGEDPAAGLPITLVAGDRFIDVDGDGVFSEGDALVPSGDANSNGVWDPLGTVPSSVVTNGSGAADFVLQSDAVAGVTWIRATAEGTSAETAIQFTSPGAPLPAEMVCSADPVEIGAEETSTIHVYVYDTTNNNPVEDGTEISFQVDEGMVVGTDGAGKSFTREGIASAVYHSLLPQPGGDGMATIRCSASGGTLSCTTQVRIPMYDTGLAALTLTRDRAAITVAGAGQAEGATLQAVARTTQGERVGAGVHICFRIVSGPEGGESVGGVIGGPADAVTDENGIASTTLQSGETAGRARIVASASGVESNSVAVDIRPGPAVDVRCVPGRETVAPNDTTSIFVIARDLHENPVADSTVISFSADDGMVTGEAYENATFSYTLGGYAHALFRAFAGQAGGTGWVTITASVQGGPTARAWIHIPSAPTGPASIGLLSERNAITVTGAGLVEETVLQAVVRDLEDQPVSGKQVRFEITSGPEGGETLDGVVGGPAEATSDSSGIAAVVLAAGRTAGMLRIVATTSDIWSNPVLIRIRPGPAHDLRCWSGRSSVGSDDTTSVFVQVRDVQNNPVADSTVVTFSVDDGRILGTAYNGALFSYTEGGFATAVYHSFEAQQGDDGWAIVVASIQNGPSCEQPISYPSTDQTPASIAIDRSDGEIHVRGTGDDEQTTIVATPRNIRDGILGPGVPVTFTITHGPGGGELLDGQGLTTTKETDQNGVARVTLTAGTISGTVEISATAGLASQATLINIAAGPPAFMSCSAPLSAPCGGESPPVPIMVSALVFDVYHNPVCNGTAVWLSADTGMIVGDDGLGTSLTLDGVVVGRWFPPRLSDCAGWVTSATITFQSGTLSCSRTIAKE